MGKIRLLSDALASQVAAGEVVERPASVVKELMENSIDAEARKIEVRVQRGGMSLIRVTDDGSGMNRDDALMCLERHATSKIRTAEDLDGISTLGFRGEAIPSIASVSKFRLTTRERDSLGGTEVVVNGGKLLSVKDCGEAPGTQMEIRSLFYNVPARRKFLRTENTEYSHLEQQVRLQAIAHPDVGFTLVRNDRNQFHLPPDSQPLERIHGLVGSEVADRLLEVEPMERNGVQIQGDIGGFGMGRSNKSLQLIFLNGRPVEAAMLNYALREGYHTALMKGQSPITFLFLETSPLAVDVNVHPAKREVRFRDGNSVRDAVIEAVSQTLLREQETIPGQKVRGAEFGARSSEFGDDREPERRRDAERETAPPLGQVDLIPAREQVALRNDWGELAAGPAAEKSGERDVEENRAPSEAGAAVEGLEPELEAESELGEAPPQPLPVEAPPKVTVEDFRIIGVLGKLYVLMESNEGLVLMDQHAAHER
ncbi:MAG: DNA mismatch repair endonuclease MutL, partial [Verrucomicrobiota bacterium]